MFHHLQFQKSSIFVAACFSGTVTPLSESKEEHILMEGEISRIMKLRHMLIDQHVKKMVPVIMYLMKRMGHTPFVVKGDGTHRLLGSPVHA